MWETIKNDAILKTVTIIILGVLGFGFAFNLMFGQNTMNPMAGGEMRSGSMMGNGYPLGNTLSFVLFATYKVFLIALIIVLIFAFIKFANQYLLKGDKLTMGNIKQDSTFKTLSIIVVTVLSIGLISTLFGGMTNNDYLFGMNNGDMSNMMGSNYMMNSSYMMGTGYTYGYHSLLIFLLIILLSISIIGLIVGIAMYLFRNYPTSHQKVIEKTVCHICGNELKQEWKCCPSCGSEKITKEVIENNPND